MVHPPVRPRPVGRVARRRARSADLTRALLVAVVLVACGSPSPSAPPSATALPTASPSATPTPRPPDARSAAAAVTEAGLRSDLEALAAVTEAATGYRATGSPGYEAAADLVGATLTEAGWTVSEDAYTAQTFADDGRSSLAIGGADYGPADVLPLVFAPAGEVAGPVVAIDWDPEAADRTGKGCQAADYGELPAGAIVLVRSGPCFRRDQVLAAQAAGAAAFVGAYPSAPSGAVPRATLIDPGDLRIPGLAAAGPAAEALAAAAAAGDNARLITTAVTSPAPTRTILAELPGSQPDRVVMLGAHLDSVVDGPGLNDDGSGVAALLAIARALAGSRPRATVRLAFWSAEELGLHGSRRYVAGLADPERGAIVAYLNADMVASPNGFAGVYDAAEAPEGSAAVAALLDAAVERAGGQPVEVAIGGGSDHAPFAMAGIPIGGVFSGAAEPLSTEQAASAGGLAGQPADACYHRACDDLENVDLGLARTLTAALADVTVRLAMTPELVTR